MSDPIEELRAFLDEGQMSFSRPKIVEAITAYDALRAELEKVKGERKDDQEYIESLCKDLCAMEDALGFKNDCHDKDGALVPTIGPWLERVRDLVAAEGELGDLKEALYSERAANAGLREALERLLVHANEFYSDWMKGDFTLCKLAQCDMESMAEQFIPAGKALATDAGKLFLDRLREAEGKVERYEKLLKFIEDKDNTPLWICDYINAALTPPTTETKVGK